MLVPQESFAEAVTHLQAGRCAEAVDVARRLVSLDPYLADAWQLKFARAMQNVWASWPLACRVKIWR